MTDHLASLMGPVARELLGEPNRALSSKKELRFGAYGSLSVDLEKGVWHDHEAGEGGGLLDLITRATGAKERARFEWLKDHGYELPDWRTRDKLRGNNENRAVSAPRPNGGGKLGPIVATYNYVDEHEDFLFQVTRHDPKDFRQRTRNEFGEWVRSVKGVRQVPYHLPDLIEALASERLVFIAEGEKDADNLRKLGIPATTNAMGAGKWPVALDQYFAGADVVIIADNDPQKRHPLTDKPMFHDDGRPILPGQDHARDVARHLNGIAARVRVLDLGKVWPACPPKGDISDWIAAGGGAEALYALIEPLPDWDKAEPATAPRRKALRVRALHRDKGAGLEDSVALEFAEQHAADIRYVAASSQWMRWATSRWQAEKTLVAFDLSRALCRSAGDARAKTVAAIVTLARTDRRIAATEEQWDRSLMSLNLKEAPS